MRFLIHAKHQRILRGIHIETYDGCLLFFKLWIRTLPTPVLYLVGFEISLVEDAVDGGTSEACRLREGSDGPLVPTILWLHTGEMCDLKSSIRGDDTGPSRTFMILDPFHTLFDESHAPPRAVLAA